MNNSWNLDRLKKQAIGNQNFDDYVLNESGILEYDDLKVLDIGCSNGFKTKLLFDKYNNIKNILGIDIDECAIDEAKSNFKDNAKYEFELKSIDDLDEKNKYDIINLSYVLQHLKNPSEILSKIQKILSDRGVIIIKVPDDSFKFCYPDSQHLLNRIFNLYENQIMIKQNITKYTDRYIGKKVYGYLIENNYKNVQLYQSITDTIGKTLEERLKLYESSIAFRSANNKNNISDKTKAEMNELLNTLKENFKKENFYYTMSVFYYVAKK